ncbi:MFS transporter [Nocardia stercoris]|uniref:MFS transporter n=1 Tax=Nocardia stercoris TaxID=2483361 RepID=A0A3M2L2C2_9NOCA|nr:MFS transporter [Nocardia stercoris]RMI31691.1 MFS transporter [Nocardia stercoris]
MDTAGIMRQARRARVAVFGVFGLNGFLAAMWVVHIPAITGRTGVSHAVLGVLILVMALGGIAGMQAVGPVADRFGSRAVVAAALGALAVTVLGPALATGPVALGAALLAFGAANGALDVSMNAQAVHVERVYGRPIMSAFHGAFSCGGLAGSLLGAAALRANWALPVTFTATAILGALAACMLTRHLLPAGSHTGTTIPGTGTTPTPRSPTEATDSDAAQPHRPTAASAATGPDAAAAATAAQPHQPTAASAATGPDGAAAATAAQPHQPATASATGAAAAGSVNPARGRRGPWRRVLPLAVLAFAVLMTEGVANDWSALQVREHLRVSSATAALAFGAFSTTMTLGRFTADRICARIGRVAVVRWGTLLAAAGLGLIIAVPWLPTTLAGWALLGAGLAGAVPQIFTAAGNLGSSTPTTDMSRVFGIGYLGFLAGPSVIGRLSESSSLTIALLFPLAAVLLCAAGAGVVVPPGDEPAGPVPARAQDQPAT